MDADAKDVLGVLLKSDKVEQGPAGNSAVHLLVY